MPSLFPSLRSVGKFALASAQVALGPASLAQAGTPVSCPNPQLSCQNTTAVADTCCFNAPGGQLLLTQFWNAAPDIGPTTSWTVHGLWPDKCDGTYEAYCDPARELKTDAATIIQSFGKTELLNYMRTYWKSNDNDDDGFWTHEFDKHGTCISTYEPQCYTGYTPQEEVVGYFEKTVDLFKTLNTYQILAASGILPSTTKTYTSAEIQAAIAKTRGGREVTIGCSSGALREVWYHYNVQGSVQTGNFIAADPDGTKSTCPATGIKYIPKGGSSPPSTTTRPASSSSSTPPSATGAPFSGRGYLNAVTGGRQTGCLISSGKWYASGTCATLTAAASGTGFKLTSSKGQCGIVSGSFTCGSSVPATIFSSSAGFLVADGSSTLYADSVPSGVIQATVYTTQRATAVQFKWQAV
ncbi:MAG: ribonuclease T2-like [Caeruleum heppii]|nr:MAG: ribonuclease T2-like [Caeruleum heppii]